MLPSGPVSPDELKALRKALSCTAKELADTLGIDHKLMAQWELGELFPTKKSVVALRALEAQGPAAIKRQRRGKQKASPQDRLRDPRLWELVRKLIELPDFFDQVEKLARDYPDPAGTGGSGE